MTDLKHKAAASVRWASLETWGQQLVQLALFAVLARLLGPKAYGLVGLAITIAQRRADCEASTSSAEILAL